MRVRLRQSSLLCATVFLVCRLTSAFGQTQNLVFDPASLAAKLRQMEGALGNRGDAAVLADLPSSWEVATPERRYSISTEPLRLLLSADPLQRAVSLELATSWLDHLAQNLEGYFRNAPDSPSDAPARLDQILSRSEFAGVRSPNALERLQQRIQAWIQRILRAIFEIARDHPTGSEFLFWLTMAAAVGFVGISLLHFWSRDAGLILAPATSGPSLERSTRQWLNDARAAADSGDLRQAIRCAYWAGISHLQDAALVPKDLTLTPREQLRRADPGAGFLEPLSALTAGLERFWYARKAAETADFSESLRQLERLGCRQD